MSDEERRTLIATAAVLLLASVLRFGWEVRPLPPVLPPEGVPAELLEETRLALERDERMRTPLGPGERVDPNREPEVELARLPGVGPALAARIVESRTEEGPFRTAQELLRVTGIGPAILERIEPLLDLTDPPPPVGGGGMAGGGPGAAVGSAPPIDLNRAGPADLETLPGIGPALASRIIDHRGRMGRFSRVEDLLEVPGIGPATLERLRPLVRVGG